jgi:multidrug efflux pump subunit AcrA (membrane-fusion protein)
VRRKAVQLGRLVASRVVVDGPLAAGEHVVVAGQSQLADGDTVEVAP